VFPVAKTISSPSGGSWRPRGRGFSVVRGGLANCFVDEIFEPFPADEAVVGDGPIDHVVLQEGYGHRLELEDVIAVGEEAPTKLPALVPRSGDRIFCDSRTLSTPTWRTPWRRRPEDDCDLRRPRRRQGRGISFGMHAKSRMRLKPRANGRSVFIPPSPLGRSQASDPVNFTFFREILLRVSVLPFLFPLGTGDATSFSFSSMSIRRTPGCCGG